jgi:transcriptional/translational regulatory protein YebC/TACO1
MFQTKGIITYDASKYTEEQIFEVALENGADDVTSSDGVIEVNTAPSDFANVLEALQAAGFEQESAEIEKVADLNVSLDADKARKVLKIIDKLEELDDVQQVSTNLELPDDFEDGDEE